MRLLSLWLACAVPTDSRPEAEDSERPPQATSAGDSASATAEAWSDAPSAPQPVLSIEAPSGPAPHRTGLSAGHTVAETPWTASWELGDGSSTSGVEIEHEWCCEGSYDVLLGVEDRYGQQAWTEATVEVGPPLCPQTEEGSLVAEVELPALDEASGLAASRVNGGVLWTHNDSGGGAVLHAIRTDGTALGSYTLEDASAKDWEDMAAASPPDGSPPRLYVGDIGDNAEQRSSIEVYIVEDPGLSPEAPPTDGSLEPLARLSLSYPDRAQDAEALAVDPLTEDIYLVTKDRNLTGITGVYRKPAPHVDGEEAELELVSTLDLISGELLGITATGADFSPSGDLFVLRTYLDIAYAWRREADQDLAQALESEACPLELPDEPGLAESIAMGVEEQAIYLLPEGESPPLYRVPWER